MHKLITKALIEDSKKENFINPMLVDKQFTKITNISSFYKQSSKRKNFLDLSKIEKTPTRIYVPLILISDQEKAIKCKFTYDTGSDFTFIIPKNLYSRLGSPKINPLCSKNVSMANDNICKMECTNIKIKVGSYYFIIEALIGDSETPLIGTALIPTLFSLSVINDQWKIAPSNTLSKMLG